METGLSAPVTWQFGTRRKYVDLSFTEPWLFGTPTLAGIDLFDPEEEAKRADRAKGKYDEFTAAVDDVGWGPVRVAMADGESFALTDDYRVGRVNVAIETRDDAESGRCGGVEGGLANEAESAQASQRPVSPQAGRRVGI